MTYHLCEAKGVIQNTEATEATDWLWLESLGTSLRTPTRGSLLLLAVLRAMPSCNREPSVPFWAPLHCHKKKALRRKLSRFGTYILASWMYHDVSWSKVTGTGPEAAPASMSVSASSWIVQCQAMLWWCYPRGGHARETPHTFLEDLRIVTPLRSLVA